LLPFSSFQRGFRRSALRQTVVDPEFGGFASTTLAAAIWSMAGNLLIEIALKPTLRELLDCRLQDGLSFGRQLTD